MLISETISLKLKELLNVKVEGFSDEIIEALKEFANEVEEKVETVITNGSKEILKNLKKHPIIPELTGKYRKSFKLKKTGSGPGYIRYKLWNEEYRLTHLLEHGHIKRNGTGRTKTYPHWRDAQAQAEELAEVVKKELEE